MTYPNSALSKHPHAAGCDGVLYRLDTIALTDVVGRVGNGGLVAHDYRCGRSWAGCGARVLVAEYAVRRLAVDVEVRP